MRRWTIAGMLGLVAVIGVALAAIREASLAWGAAIPLIAGAVLSFAALMAILRRGRRAGWLGFAALGTGYFAVSVLSTAMIGPLPVLTPWIDSLSERLDPPPPPMRDVWLPRHEWLKLPLEQRRTRAIMFSQDSEKYRIYTRDLTTRREATRSIAHSLLSLVLGGIGALLTGLWARIRRFGLSTEKEANAPCL